MSSDDRVLLRYTGSHATAFNDAGMVEPGEEFEVSAADEERFTRHADVERAVKAGTSGKPRGGRRGDEPSTQDAQD